ncbi:hypothetical protein HJC23_009490 [Cyclotella cryptica]|uniref:EamA domain-containing protein n=1 Tax=Cyclotella cryptica TaxID=29204 RepID=A0ABD3PAR7_9STRA|eukprot:CCRYP_017275-RA/>CCRYP_017275-RA protein AED:0.38 eAED:0.38 QI:182/1/1/1/1/1/2/229/405
MSSDSGVDWVRGVTYSVLASLIGAASKLSIRKSWLVYAELEQHTEHESRSADIDDHDRNRLHDAETSTKDDITVSPHGIISGNPFTDGNDRLLAPLEVATWPQHHSMQDSHLKNRDDGSCFFFDPIREPLSRRKSKQHNQKAISWILYASGMIGMTILNPLCCVLAMKYANPSILAPFSGLTLVWVVMLSGCYVGERPERIQKVACGLIILGQVIVAAFGDHTNRSDVTLQEVVESYKDPAFLAFIIFMATVLGFLVISIYTSSKTSLLRKLAWGSIGGTITGFQNFLKDALSLSSTKPLPSLFFLFAFLAMFTAFVGLLFLAACMKRFDATYSAAMFVASFVLSATFMSAVHYRTFQELDHVVDNIMYPIGLLILLFGAWMLVSDKKEENESDESHGSDSLLLS